MFQTLVHYTKAWINYYIFVQRFNHQQTLTRKDSQVMDLDGVFKNVI